MRKINECPEHDLSTPLVSYDMFNYVKKIWEIKLFNENLADAW